MEWELFFNPYRVSVWDDVRVLEMDSGGSCTKVNVLNAFEPFT